ncbi:oxygen-dependent tRNA uridine(34) hydroxylase TrhO [Auraticoccus monumenti]|uniref:tRNA uridine(34) hydroxylase n=1 Tax=Auraticoccus monumenti TaxID=675864 RepID=A0A1G6S2J0_9ACTN|nr:rhodanese-related sulfurtransferase [Auraticoccus monumenti]SDD11132.1 UPF0176 protein [Auraticoccus monumenti]
MAIPKVLGCYRFTPLADPAAVRLWQLELCRRLGLLGRVLVAEDGINASLAGDVTVLKSWLRATREHEPFAGLEPSWTDGTGSEFTRLRVLHRPELVTFGVRVPVDEDGVRGTGRRISPAQLDALVAERGEEVALLDGRNRWEASIGRFAGAVVPDVETTRDFVMLLDEGGLDHLRDRPVITYCTGGIRCEVLSALMVQRGFEEVYQLDGGILAYGRDVGDAGLWQGALHVFDQRHSISFSDAVVAVGECGVCGGPASRVADCRAACCGRRVPLCDACATEDRCAEHRVVSGPGARSGRPPAR